MCNGWKGELLMAHINQKESYDLLNSVKAKMQKKTVGKGDYEKMEKHLNSLHAARLEKQKEHNETNNMILQYTDCLSKMKSNGI